jgi:ribosomal protection tetracycline resistance protein
MHTLNIGILAHVDAGKTSLTERLLFDHGAVDQLGSVDAGDTRTDDGEIERRRGITIRSAVAAFTVGDTQVNLIDTPGHSDFTAEVERALEVLDGAVLLLSAVEGVQARTRVLMRTLRRLRLPTLVFVNKIDRAGARAEGLLADIRHRLTPDVVPLTEVTAGLGGAGARVRPRRLTDPLVRARTAEALAEVDTDILAAVVDGPEPTADEVRAALAARTADGSFHPLYFGSALGGQGVAELARGLVRLVPARSPAAGPVPPRGTVFAVHPGPGGERTAYLRLYDGEVRPRQRLTFLRRESDGRTGEVRGRVTRLEVIGGAGTLTAGNIAALSGPAALRVGDRLGGVTDRAPQFAPPTLETLVRARRPEQAAPLRSALLALADQDPLLHARPAESGATALLLYGEVQMEVLAATLAGDFGIEAEFSPGRVRFLERPDGTGEAVDEMPWHDHTRYWATIGLRGGAGAARLGRRVRPRDGARRAPPRLPPGRGGDGPRHAADRPGRCRGDRLPGDADPLRFQLPGQHGRRLPRADPHRAAPRPAAGGDPPLRAVPRVRGGGAAGRPGVRDRPSRGTGRGLHRDDGGRPSLADHR